MSEKDEAAKPVQWATHEEGVPTIYVNHVQALMGPFDFTIRLGHLAFFDSPEGVAAKELVRVFMSPLHVKALRDLLNRQVTAYESRFGEIPDIAARLADLGEPEGADESES